MVAKEVGEHVVEADHRYRQDEHDPEKTSELSDVVCVPGMTAVVFMSGVMLPRLVVAGGVMGRVRVMMLGYRRAPIVEAPGRVATGSVPVAVVMMIVRLTHSFTSVLSRAARLA
ncbi:hypothetical protein [Rhodococcus sp. IEGM 1408]|uniref:hypothetical protein n=1 Tax=Rhodococcus sp. IEGM 1408 TaxID=3082220 RepID=UPI0029531F1F|nr:hypothetical protein [Rhodococcus sp. IEGM 1408]MDV8003156.1 hypothetical protein [Rhodococcus sp. IEGM 1408]